MKRKRKQLVKVGSISIGYSHKIVIQSMTKVPTTEIGRCIQQIQKLIDAGCDLVRIAVPRRADTEAFAKIVQKIDIPLIADIHFSPERAIEAIEAGASKIRLNPGNIKNPKDIIRIIDAAKMHKTAIRIGVNEASIADYQTEDVANDKRVALMLREMKKYVKLFEKQGFDKIVLSAKSSDALRTIEINRKISENFDYPIHMGLTHAGLPEDAEVPSAVTLGTLLAEGIGDTIRVSAAGDPVKEVIIAKKILISLGYCERSEPELVVCPTCGRAEIDIVQLAQKVKKAISGIKKPLRVAVMGCVVNGPGEAAHADIALCAAKNKAYIYRKGKRVAIVPDTEAITALLNQLKKL
ncbi:MAG: flavodoxin-dependent (E)-4-hydroxy-3-methylbut-2-enyl-diphosphate synthase [Sedimentisphaerales bacterium]|nr:flavodoxin-dependent (E)-4-hydroxy-3-methylbut-2-enyl-diphosphate synthase [Sedimentisphaerales bacterium]